MTNTKEKKSTAVKLYKNDYKLLSDYVQMLKDNNIKNDKGYIITRGEIIHHALKNVFQNKILINDYITLDKPFYFNMNDLINNKSVEASQDIPIKDLENTYIINKIPNNLDSFNKDYETYCFNNQLNSHRGILFNYKHKFSLEFKNEFTFTDNMECLILIFDYKLKSDYIIKSKTTLNIAVIDYNSLDLYLPKDGNIINNYNYELEYLNYILTDSDINISKRHNIFNSNDKILKPFYKTKNNLKSIEKDNINYDFTKAVFNPEYSLNKLLD